MMAPTTGSTGTAWERGRFDARGGPRKILFGRMYEDAAIESAAFRPGGRIFCIASAGCTAIALASSCQVVAVDINPLQLDYAQRRCDGAPALGGTAERVMACARTFAPLVGWRVSRLREFLDLADTTEQLLYWRRHLDTRRFRAAFDGLLSLTALRTVYAMPFLDFLPPRLGAVMRARLQRGFARHANRDNPFARALLLGELPEEAMPAGPRELRFVHADAAAFLEREATGSFDGFALSNILDGADAGYERRLLAAVKRAASAEAVLVLRSFREPAVASASNRAAQDRSMLWGVVDVKPVSTLG